MEEAEAMAIEAELVRLPEVEIARLVTDPDGRLSEVHVVANGAKPAKQVARDIQSVALASFGVEIDRRIISVVQLDPHELRAAAHDGAADDIDARTSRVAIESVRAEVTGVRCVVRVGLSRDEVSVYGEATGTVAASARFRLVAAATIDALRGLEPDAECLDVDAAQIVRVGSLDVAIATVVFVSPPTEQVVSGSAVVTAHDEPAAIARAVLDATNRKLANHRRLPSNGPSDQR
jgi:hypothetical protein